MSKTHKDKKQLPTNAESPSFEEKKRAAYSQMGQLGGMARAKQMAEQGFTPKIKPNPPNKNKSNKSPLEKEEKNPPHQKKQYL